MVLQVCHEEKNHRRLAVVQEVLLGVVEQEGLLQDVESTMYDAT